jgi:hypothetical protein
LLQAYIITHTKLWQGRETSARSQEAVAVLEEKVAALTKEQEAQERKLTIDLAMLNASNAGLVREAEAAAVIPFLSAACRLLSVVCCLLFATMVVSFSIALSYSTVHT